jgi:hypothetical protein
MDPLRYLAETQGFFSRATAREVGYHDKAVTQMMRSRVWHRIRRGYYTYADIWAKLTPEGRHLARAHAVLDSLGDNVALSGVSGLLEHGVATWGISLDRVHVTRLDGGAGRTEGDVVHHEGLCLDSEVADIGGRRVLSAPRCAIEACSRTSPESGLVSFDSMLFLGKCTGEELERQFRSMHAWPFTRRLTIPVLMADGRAESPGESRGRWLFWSCGLPAPFLQYEIRDPDGGLIGICDWGWPDLGLLGEFDGRIKYGRLLLPGQLPGDVVFAEKRREDRLREVSGCAMIRLTWEDLERPRVTRGRIETLLRRAG